MTVESGLRAFLLADATILAAVATRWFPGSLPQKVDLDTLGNCAIVSVFVSNPGGLHLRGPWGTTTARFQLDAWCRTADGAMALGRRIRWRLNGYQGTWSDMESPMNTVGVQCIKKDQEQRIPEIEIHGGLYRHSGDYLITYSASDEQVLV